MTSIPATTSGKLAQLIPKLTEADRRRLLHFAEAMLAQKQGKQQQRAKRRERPVVEGWRVGD